MILINNFIAYSTFFNTQSYCCNIRAGSNDFMLWMILLPALNGGVSHNCIYFTMRIRLLHKQLGSIRFYIVKCLRAYTAFPLTMQQNYYITAVFLISNIFWWIKFGMVLLIIKNLVRTVLLLMKTPNNYQEHKLSPKKIFFEEKSYKN